MMRTRLYLMLLAAALLLLAACNGQATTPEATAVSEIVVTDTVAAVLPAATTTPGATASPTEPAATALPAVTDTSVATATLSPVRATQQALANAVQVPTRSETSVIAADDYVALTNQACAIVEENYVRSNFNGVDWQATCEAYRERAQAVDDQETFWDLMEQFIAELHDEHSRFVRPDSFAAEFNLPSQGEGIPWPGLSINPAREDERLLLWDVCGIGPAARAGLRRGDVVRAIDGETFTPGERGFDRNEILQALYGGGKDEVTLTVLQGPGAEPRDVHLEYGGASGCDGWTYGVLSEEPYVGYIRVPDFGGNADTTIMTMIERLEEERPLEGLVVDVRHNPGGNADESVSIFTMGDFGQIGKLREGATQRVYRIRGPVRWNEETPVAVLIDGASHSAAEYFATAMQQSGRATLVGMPTAGNTEGITGFNLADGSLIRLAVQTLQLPDGSLLEDVGVLPDVRVPLGEWGLRQTPDVQLEAAYRVVAGE